MADEEKFLNEWAQATSDAQLAMAREEYDTARDFYIDAHNAALAIRDESPIFYALTQVAFGRVSLLVNDATTAAFFLADALETYRKYFGETSANMLELYHLIANVHHQMKMYSEAKVWYETTLIYMDLANSDDRDKLEVYANFAAMLDEEKADLADTGTISLVVDLEDDEPGSVAALDSVAASCSVSESDSVTALDSVSESDSVTALDSVSESDSVAALDGVSESDSVAVIDSAAA